MKNLIIALILSASFLTGYAQNNQAPKLTTYRQWGRVLDNSYSPEALYQDSLLKHGGLPISGRFTIDTAIVYYVDTVAESLLTNIAIYDSTFLSITAVIPKVIKAKIASPATLNIGINSFIIGGFDQTGAKITKSSFTAGGPPNDLELAILGGDILFNNVYPYAYNLLTTNHTVIPNVGTTVTLFIMRLH